MAGHSLVEQILSVKTDTDRLPIADTAERLRNVPVAPLVSGIRSVMAGSAFAHARGAGVEVLRSETDSLHERLAALLTGTGNPEALLALSGMRSMADRIHDAETRTALGREALRRMNEALGQAAMAAAEAEQLFTAAANDTEGAGADRALFDRQINVYLPAIS